MSKSVTMAFHLNRAVNRPISALNPAAAEARGSLCSLQQLVINPIKRLAAGTTITLLTLSTTGGSGTAQDKISLWCLGFFFSRNQNFFT